MESRAQDQHLLAVALGSLLSKHSPTLNQRIEGRDSTQVTLNDLDDKGFTVMVWAELLLDVTHGCDNVQDLLEIFAYPSTQLLTIIEIIIKIKNQDHEKTN